MLRSGVSAVLWVLPPRIEDTLGVFEHIIFKLGKRPLTLRYAGCCLTSELSIEIVG